MEDEKGGFDKFSDYLKNHPSIEETNENNSKIKQFANYLLFGFHNNCYLMLNDYMQVVYVDCERLTEYYVSKNFLDFMLIVIYFNKMVIRIINGNPGEFFQDCITESDLSNLVHYIKEIDEDAAGNDSFWSVIIEEIKDTAD